MGYQQEKPTQTAGEKGVVTGVALLAAAESAQYPFMGQCAWNLGTLRVSSLGHFHACFSLSPLHPRPTHPVLYGHPKPNIA